MQQFGGLVVECRGVMSALAPSARAPSCPSPQQVREGWDETSAIVHGVWRASEAVRLRLLGRWRSDGPQQSRPESLPETWTRVGEVVGQHLVLR